MVLLISLYRIADVVMGVMANIFYLEKGYKISEIATFSKFLGVFATIFGGFIGGYCSYRFGTMIALFFGALIAALSNLLFAWLAVSPISIDFLIAVITADNISSGFAGAAFVDWRPRLNDVAPKKAAVRASPRLRAHTVRGLSNFEQRRSGHVTDLRAELLRRLSLCLHRFDEQCERWHGARAGAHVSHSQAVLSRDVGECAQAGRVLFSHGRNRLAEDWVMVLCGKERIGGRRRRRAVGVQQGRLSLFCDGRPGIDEVGVPYRRGVVRRREAYVRGAAVA